MKKIILPLFLALSLLLASCAGSGSGSNVPPEEGTLTIAATTYPVYLFTTAVTEGVTGVEVKAVVNQPMSCLHDYTLTVNDMKVLEGADVIALNGVGLEDFMSDALNASSALRIDASQGAELLPYEGHADHEHSESEEDQDHFDPHIWMSSTNAAIMVQNLADGLAEADPDHADAYQANATQAVAALDGWNSTMADWLEATQSELALPHRELITFHDGFQYLAHSYDLTILKAIEEEEGSEASAADIKEIVGLIQEYDLPAIFTEVNGSNATAQAISRETGVEVGELTMIMSGEGEGLTPYFSAMEANAKALVNGLGDGQVTLE